MKTHFNSIFHNQNMPFSQNTFKYLSKLFILCISLHNLSSHFYEYQKIIEKRNVKFPLWKIYNVLNISSSTITFPKYPLEIPQNQHLSNRPSCCKIQRNLRNFDVPPLFLNKKKRKKEGKENGGWKKKEIAQDTSGKDNKRSLFIETSVATGWHVRFIYDAIEPLPINPSTSRVSCEGGTKAASADRYRADIRTISRRSSRGNLHRGNGKKVQRTSSSGRITIDWRVLDMCALSTETVSSFRRQMFLLRNAIIQ